MPDLPLGTPGESPGNAGPDRSRCCRSGIEELLRQVRAEAVVNLARLAQLVHVDPLIDGMSLIDRARAKHNGRDARGRESRGVGAVPGSLFLARPLDRSNVRQQAVRP